MVLFKIKMGIPFQRRYHDSNFDYDYSNFSDSDEQENHSEWLEEIIDLDELARELPRYHNLLIQHDSDNAAESELFRIMRYLGMLLNRPQSYNETE